MLIVSKCLAGEPCRYDGKDNLVPIIKKLVERGEAFAVCPEVLGGLPTPRTPSEIQPDGRILSKQGEDVTEAFVRGAERAMAICRECGCTGAILKARSPSCGKGVIYDGSFTGKRVTGNGVFAQMLLDAVIPVMTEEEYTKKESKKMGLFDSTRKSDINEGVRTCAATPGAMLLDVRNPDEYAMGHIPGSVNLPLSEIRTAEDQIPDMDTPLFIYCLSGARSSRAVAELRNMGYTNLCNLGGISKWRGEIEK